MMRNIELILSLLGVFSALFFLFPSKSSQLKFKVLPLALVLVGALQVGWEGFRWQLWPLMIAILLLLWAAWRGLHGRTIAALAGISLVLAGLALAAGWLLPIPKPFVITGPYQVGTTVFPLKDSSRLELYAADPEALREMMVQVWYPATPAAGDPQAYWIPDIEFFAPTLAEWFDLPAFSLSHLKFIRANAFVDAPLIPGDEKLPVLIFSHGWSGFKEQNTFQVEELASHGYIVIGINHTYGAMITVFPDGRQMPQNEEALPEGVSEEEYDLASNLLVRQWAQDIGFVLDEFMQWDQAAASWPFAGRLDFSEIGVFGHSTGGGAAAEFCATDFRCKAALMMDLWVEPVSDSVVASGLAQPYLMMHSAAWVNLEEPSPNFLRLGELVSASSGQVVEFRIEGTSHHDFTNLPLVTPLANAIGLKGPIPGDIGLSLINYYSLAFFDQYLRGADQGLLLPENAPYPEAQFDLRP